MAEFARGFRLTTPGGEVYDGAEFPNGFVLTCHREQGLDLVAISMGNLLDRIGPGPIHILWDPKTEED